MNIDYSESAIQEVLDDLVASGEIVRVGDGYYCPESAEEGTPTNTEQGRAIEQMISAFDLVPGDFVSMSFFSDGVEVRTNRASQ